MPQMCIQYRMKPLKKNTKYKKAKKMNAGGPVKSGIARACGKVMNDRRKVTKYYQRNTGEL